MKSWKEILNPVMNSSEMLQLREWLKTERETKKIYPDPKDTLRVFDLCPYRNTKVVILGQDPYHTPGTADGLAFSSKQAKTPASLLNIFKEIYIDLNIQYFHNMNFSEFFPTNSLDNWANNGFLLLNTILTVEEGQPLSHKGKGWERLISVVFDALNEHPKRIVFLLWGKQAQEYEKMINTDKHLVFTAPHPASDAYKSGAGFVGCKHFSIVRDILPTIHNETGFETITLNSCFDKEKAVEIVKREYPKEAEKLEKYIRKEMIISVPVNESKYIQSLRSFELSLSTKQEK